MYIYIYSYVGPTTSDVAEMPPSVKMPCCDPTCARCSEHRGGFKFPWIGQWSSRGVVIPAHVAPDAAWDFYYDPGPCSGDMDPMPSARWWGGLDGQAMGLRHFGTACMSCGDPTRRTYAGRAECFSWRRHCQQYGEQRKMLFEPSYRGATPVAFRDTQP